MNKWGCENAEERKLQGSQPHSLIVYNSDFHIAQIGFEPAFHRQCPEKHFIMPLARFSDRGALRFLITSVAVCAMDRVIIGCFIVPADCFINIFPFCLCTVVGNVL